MLDQLNRQDLKGITAADVHDRQHLNIKHRQQELRTAMIIGMGMSRIIACSKDLIRATLFHFQSEESVMNSDKLQGSATHRRFHAEMIESLKEISNDLERRQISGAMELMRLFDERLTHHLDVEDAAFESEVRNIKK